MRWIIEKQRDFFNTTKTYDLNTRLSCLKKLKRCIKKYEKDIYDALYNDLRKPRFEAYVGEVGFIIREIDFVLKHLKDWVKPQKVKTELVNIPAESFIYRQPYGVCLILSPWNYPFHLTFLPLIGAIAAGNTAVVKPSEIAPNSESLIKEIIDNCCPSEYVSAVVGPKEIAESLLNEKFDKIFFTGNTAVGKIVMKKASEHLTPVTLELGGKSPAIILNDAKLKTATKRIVWGKFFNAGQTCVAVDYVCVEKKIYKKFMKLLIEETKRYTSMKNFTKNYSKIINFRHFKRLTQLINESNVIFGGRTDTETLTIYPTIVEAQKEDKIMEDEIFGPILPVLKFDSYEEIKDFVKAKPKPLAMYIFTEKASMKEKILREIQSGGVTINDTLIHLSSSLLPFGGIGSSGMGSYHGWFSFEEFSQKRAVVDRSTAIDIPLRYPPYGSVKFYSVKKIFYK
ncbi:aldehyde dehydrogenase family protein [Hippea jasoniae]|uniref:aldehyde dehydrogenase family protein n=1 Tax=Hippea jasoniae TaxID=944479 RepID=UPI0005503C2B|nr:aldehyde dehydrogenase family protein [Hippea jasoniae]